MADRDLKVMISSTFRDLKTEREAARDAILGQGMRPLRRRIQRSQIAGC
jgi:Domain of unknown function (DUF4062)